MKIISKLLLPIALIAFVASVVLFCSDRVDFAANLGRYATTMVKFVRNRDNLVGIAVFGGVNLLLAIIYAIRRRKNKHTFNVLFLAFDLAIGFLLYVFKDSLKSFKDMYSFEKTSSILLIVGMAVTLLIALIPGKKREKEPYQARPLGFSWYLFAIIGCAVVIVYAVVAKNGFENIGKVIRQYII